MVYFQKEKARRLCNLNTLCSNYTNSTKTYKNPANPWNYWARKVSTQMHENFCLQGEIHIPNCKNT